MEFKEIHEKLEDDSADVARLRSELFYTCRMYQETYEMDDNTLVACLKNTIERIGCSSSEYELRNDVSMRLSLIENGLKKAVKQDLGIYKAKGKQKTGRMKP
jgi:hypothetical protein